jgi:ABC-type Co2+ transport system permease subunit
MPYFCNLFASSIGNPASVGTYIMWLAVLSSFSIYKYLKYSSFHFKLSAIISLALANHLALSTSASAFNFEFSRLAFASSILIFLVHSAPLSLASHDSL